MVDKSGYFKLAKRQELREKVERIKREKETARREKARTDFINSDKSEYLKLINERLTNIKNIITSVLNYDFIMEGNGFYLINNLRKSFIILNKLKKGLNDYAGYKDPAAEIYNELKQIDDNIIITISIYNEKQKQEENSKRYCDPECYLIVNDLIVARWDWVNDYAVNFPASAKIGG